jgi:hypothetical protein
VVLEKGQTHKLLERATATSVKSAMCASVDQLQSSESQEQYRYRITRLNLCDLLQRFVASC